MTFFRFRELVWEEVDGGKSPMPPIDPTTTVPNYKRFIPNYFTDNDARKKIHDILANSEDPERDLI